MQTWQCPNCKTIYTERVNSCACAAVPVWTTPSYPYPLGWWGIYPPSEYGPPWKITCDRPGEFTSTITGMVLC